MKSTRQWITFSLLRVGIFAAVMIALIALGARPWLAAVLAAVIGLCISYLFLARQREAVAASIQSYRRSEHVDVDAEAESDGYAHDDAHPDGPVTTPGSEAVRGSSEREGGSEAEAEQQRREAGQL